MSRISPKSTLYPAPLLSRSGQAAELDHLVTQLQSIVAMVEQLNEVTVAGKAPPFNAGPAQVELRPDVLAPEPLAHPLASMAPGFAGDFFAVPRHTAMEEA